MYSSLIQLCEPTHHPPTSYGLSTQPHVDLPQLRFIIDAAAANVDIMLEKPELQYYFSDLLSRLQAKSMSWAGLCFCANTTVMRNHAVIVPINDRRSELGQCSATIGHLEELYSLDFTHANCKTEPWCSKIASQSIQHHYSEEDAAGGWLAVPYATWCKYPTLQKPCAQCKPRPCMWRSLCWPWPTLLQGCLCKLPLGLMSGSVRRTRWIGCVVVEFNSSYSGPSPGDPETTAAFVSHCRLEWWWRPHVGRVCAFPRMGDVGVSHPCSGKAV